MAHPRPPRDSGCRQLVFYTEALGNLGVRQDGNTASFQSNPQADDTTCEHRGTTTPGEGIGAGRKERGFTTSQGIPAVLLQHELGQILQDLLAVQSHKLLPTDLIRGATVSCRLTGVFPSFPSVLLSQDRSEARGREGSRQEWGGGAARQQWSESGWGGGKQRPTPIYQSTVQQPLQHSRGRSPGQDRGTDSARRCV